MAHAYTPGLRVAEFTLFRKERRLPLLGEVLVKAGDRVRHDQVVARTNLPGDVQSLNIAHKLSIEASELPRVLRKNEGDPVAKDEIIAESKSFFGMFKSQCVSPITGTIETISTVTGQALLRLPPIPVETSAYVDGVVAEVHPEEGAAIETWGAYVQGIFGVGGETNGELLVAAKSPAEPFTPERVPANAQGKILVGGARATLAAIEKARQAGARGLVCAGLDDQDLKALLGRDLGVAITGHEKIGLTIVITEGFGEIAMAKRTFDLLKRHDGMPASVNGATQIRAGVIRPEIVIPKLGEPRPQAGGAAEDAGGLDVGSPVRIIREPRFGEIGTVAALPAELVTMESETKVRVLVVTLESGDRVTLPRANVEIIET